MPDSGVLIVNKPRGLTSHDVINRVRRAIKIKQVGHAGTLDPLAIGVLVVCINQATRISEYLMGHAKIYRARIRLGIETNTYDAEGELTATHDVKVTEAELRSALNHFVGPIDQIPPMHSAIKQGGQKLYDLARQGIEVDRPARSVTIHALDLINFESPDLFIEVKCSAGTYIRSIAHDLGAQLGCGAQLIELQRTASGPYTIEQAIDLEQFETAARADHWEAHLHSIDEALSDWPSVTLNETDRLRALNGASIESITLSGSRCRAHDEHGNLIALLMFDPKKSIWRADKVLKQ
ncbi:MAG TPA: tRNA pseudouridine(55) synthase TruB [Anaerolineae bacterium]|nr:tRNA pseudouridine(55) synthase TruB [Anaerolineae bacterium]